MVMKIKVSYGRVSSREQAINSNALLQQLDRLKSQNVDRVYWDISSGISTNRTYFKRLIEDIKKNLISELVVTRMDRIIRGLKAQLEFIALLEEKEIILTVLDQSVEYKTASGKLNLNILGAFAQNYSDDLSERIRHGYEYYRKLKKATHTILGYKIVDQKIVIDDEPFLCLIENKSEYSKYEIARFVIILFLKHKSLAVCLKNLNQYFGLLKSKGSSNSYRGLHFSRPGLLNYLTHPSLRGYLVYFHYNKNKHTQLFPNNHHPILSESEYVQIVSILKQNKKVGGYGFVSKHPFSGFIFCQECYHSMHISQNWNRLRTIFYVYYKCRNAEAKSCTNSKAIRIEKLKSKLFSVLQSQYLELTTLATTIDSPLDSSEIQSLRHQIQSLALLPNNPAIDQAITNIQLQIQSLQSEQSQNQLIHSENKDYLKTLFSSSSFWESLLPHQLKEIVHKLVDKILIVNGEVAEIKLKL